MEKSKKCVVRVSLTNLGETWDKIGLQTLPGKSWTCQGGLQWISSFDARNDDDFGDGDVDQLSILGQEIE